jgi:cyclase
VLKVRILPTLLYRDVELVKGEGFDPWRRIGSVMQSIKVYNLREVDELVFLDISATRAGHPPDFALIDEIADECFMPLTVGGGIRTIEDVRGLLKVGADKVAVNTAAVESPDLIRQIASRFGSQCVVVSINYRRRPDGSTEVWTRSGTQGTGRDPVDLARQAESFGAGEILLTSIDRDGTKSGFDCELTAVVSEAVSIPVIASGGAGTFDHFVDVFTAGKADAALAASIFHYAEHQVADLKAYLREHGIPVRL